MPIQIRLTVLGRGTADGGVDVQITAPADTPLAAVLGSLAAAAVPGAGAPGTVYCEDERLDPQLALLGQPPLVEGAVLSFHQPLTGPRPPATAARLLVVAGPDAGGVHLLNGGEVRIGRSSGADVALRDPDVSRLHCALTLGPDGSVTVTDLDSTNGTQIDGRPVTAPATPLPAGAPLRLGESTLRVVPAATVRAAGAAEGSAPGLPGRGTAAGESGPDGVTPAGAGGASRPDAAPSVARTRPGGYAPETERAAGHDRENGSRDGSTMPAQRDGHASEESGASGAPRWREERTAHHTGADRTPHAPEPARRHDERPGTATSPVPGARGSGGVGERDPFSAAPGDARGRAGGTATPAERESGGRAREQSGTTTGGTTTATTGSVAPGRGTGDGDGTGRTGGRERDPFDSTRPGPRGRTGGTASGQDAAAPPDGGHTVRRDPPAAGGDEARDALGTRRTVRSAPAPSDGGDRREHTGGVAEGRPHDGPATAGTPRGPSTHGTLGGGPGAPRPDTPGGAGGGGTAGAGSPGVRRGSASVAGTTDRPERLPGTGSHPGRDTGDGRDTGQDSGRAFSRQPGAPSASPSQAQAQDSRVMAGRAGAGETGGGTDRPAARLTDRTGSTGSTGRTQDRYTAAGPPGGHASGHQLTDVPVQSRGSAAEAEAERHASAHRVRSGPTERPGTGDAPGANPPQTGGRRGSPAEAGAEPSATGAAQHPPAGTGAQAGRGLPDADGDGDQPHTTRIAAPPPPRERPRIGSGPEGHRPPQGQQGQQGPDGQVTLVGQQAVRQRKGIVGWALRVGRGAARAADPEEAAAARAEAAAADARWPDPAAILLSALEGDPRLWARDAAHPEAYTVRLGTTQRPAGPLLPVTIGLPQAGSLGLAGPRERLTGLARTVLAQLAALHAPSALRIAVLADGGAREWSWLGWLPHLRPARGENCRLLLGFDPAQITARLRELSQVAREPDEGPRTVVLLDGDPGSAAAREAAARLAAEGPAAGIHLLVLTETPPATPASPLDEALAAARRSSAAFRACGTAGVLSGAVATSLRLIGEDGQPGPVVTADAVSPAWAERFARALAPLREQEDGAVGAPSPQPLPENVRLLDVLALPRVTPSTLRERWAHRSGLPFVLGLGGTGPVEANLAAARAPLMIAGPPASGRTELLCSLAVSLAASAGPAALSLLLIEGSATGGGLRPAAELPQVAGHLAATDPVRMRAFAQDLRAELKRRALLLGEEASGAASSGVVAPRPPADDVRREAALPRLVVLVDDLDLLLAPPLGAPGRPAAGSVIRVLESIAREGHRLGVHLITAGSGGAPGTGTPGGRLPDTAWARVALSGSPAGRAELRTGSGQLIPFQVGRVTGRIPRTATLRPTVTLVDWATAGDPPARRPVRELGNGPTDIALLASAAARAGRTDTAGTASLV
ncbi:FHA domain-containing protein [Streptomyces xiamenensis]|uniref:FHA domain-containing protein n=1 Tax=Streptomyces xiamenensis TaxID=408015 RepID=UPI0037CD136B